MEADINVSEIAIQSLYSSLLQLSLSCLYIAKSFAQQDIHACVPPSNLPVTNCNMCYGRLDHALVTYCILSFLIALHMVDYKLLL